MSATDSAWVNNRSAGGTLARIIISDALQRVILGNPVGGRALDNLSDTAETNLLCALDDIAKTFGLGEDYSFDYVRAEE